jgi:hypothetical protein
MEMLEIQLRSYHPVRQDKYRVGDYVELVVDAPEFITENVGDGRVAKVINLPKKIYCASGHTQQLILDNGEKFSGYWFKPIDRPPPRRQVPAPKGAIVSIDQLYKHVNKPLWRASRKFAIVERPDKFRGDMGITYHSDGMTYHWFKLERRLNTKLSVLDHNITRNTYNDWFLFHREEDARNYINR